MDVFVGTSGYSYKAWKGAFYPLDLPDKDMLPWYAARLPAVEINSSFYRMPRAAMLEGWAGLVPAGFKFALKAPQRITHRQRLQDVDDSVSYLVEVAAALKEKQGPLLFQLPPRFSKDAPRLGAFLDRLPASCPVAFEFRHPSWFDEEVLHILSQHQAALCIAEDENGLEVPAKATADWGYLRLRREDYDEDRLEAWASWIAAQDWREVFVFFKHEDQAIGPRLAQRFLDLTSS